MQNDNVNLSAIIQKLDAQAIDEVEAGVCAAALLLDEYRNEPSGSGLTSAGVQALRDKLEEIYDKEALCDVRSSIVWALGKLYDQSLKPFLVSALKLAVATNDKDLVWQSIVALDNLGTDILPAGSGSLAEPSINFGLAQSFLARTKPMGSGR